MNAWEAVGWVLLALAAPAAVAIVAWRHTRRQARANWRLTHPWVYQAAAQSDRFPVIAEDARRAIEALDAGRLRRKGRRS